MPLSESFKTLWNNQYWAIVYIDAVRIVFDLWIETKRFAIAARLGMDVSIVFDKSQPNK